jgi:ABC-type transport system involved in multi-copper enzyme maturation permease subunit
MSAQRIPGAGSVLWTLIRVTWRRLFRGRALAVSVLIAALPIALAAAMTGKPLIDGPAGAIQLLVLALLPPMFVASSLGEEIEDRTTTYLWSRPIARWTIVIGKLLALVPVSIVLVVGGFTLATQVAMGAPPAPIEIAAMAGGVIAISSLSAGVATLVPKHGMALTIVYLVIFDITLAAVPASIHNLSITRQVGLVVSHDGSVAQPVITLAVISAVWIAVALWRIRRLES